MCRNSAMYKSGGMGLQGKTLALLAIIHTHDRALFLRHSPHGKQENSPGSLYTGKFSLVQCSETRRENLAGNLTNLTPVKH